MSAYEKISEKKTQIQGWPLYASLFFAGIVFAAGYFLSAAGTGGGWVYTLDDPYIHRAMARHWAMTGLPGINAGVYSSSSSSPLWVCLLALLDLLGAGWMEIPLILNLAAAMACVVLAYKTLCDFSIQGLKALAVLLAFFILVPVPVLVSTGMEHTLHLALLTGFIRSLTLLKKENRGAGIFLLAFAAAAVRPESVFVVLAAGLFLFFQKRAAFAAGLIAAAGLPFLFYGILNLAQGWPFFPAPFLLKGVGVWSGDNARRFHEALPLLSLFGVVLFFEMRRLLRISGNQPAAVRFWVVSFLGAAALHLGFAGIGWFYRYEAYLMGLGLLALAGQLQAETLLARKPLGVMILALFLFPVLSRGLKACSEIPAASQNIYEQQIQMARFLGQYYRGEAVLINDIGAVSAFSGVRIIDLFGLGTREVLKWQFEANVRHLQGKKPASSVKGVYETLAREQGARAAVVYEKYFRSVLPDGAVKVGTWEVPRCVACLNPELSFYALTPEEIPVLKTRLRDFQHSLPSGVNVRMMPEPADK